MNEPKSDGSRHNREAASPTESVSSPASDARDLQADASGQALLDRLSETPRRVVSGIRRRVADRPRLVATLRYGTAAGAVAASISLIWLSCAALPVVDEAARYAQRTTTVWSLPPLIEKGMPLTVEQLGNLLSAQGYRQATDRSDSSDALPAELGRLHTRQISADDRHAVAFVDRDGELHEIEIHEAVVRSVRHHGSETDFVELDPVPLDYVLDEGRVDRRPLSFEDIDQDLVQAILAAEDDGFFDHHGLSISGIARAAFGNLRAGRVKQGASTITQQVARNLFLTLERSWSRKLKEARLAIAMDRAWSKQEIFETYANIVYLGSRFGRQLVGVEAASRAYFGTGADQLEIDEAALLAGMISAPARFDPVRSPEEATSRRDWVLSRMRDLGYIDQPQYLASIERPLHLRSSEPLIWTSHFVARALDDSSERLDLPRLAGHGWQIHTTLDWLEQTRAIEAAAAVEGGHELALVSIDPQSGDVLAYLGGHPRNRSFFDRASRAQRQLGSLVKPFAFAVSFEERKLLPSSSVLDVPLLVRYDETSWRPNNALGEYKGTVTVADALRQSLNAASLRVALTGGLEQLDATLRETGLKPSSSGPSLALGAVEATPLEVALAYRTFSTLGRTGPLRFVRYLVDERGERVEVPPGPMREVMEPAAAFMTTDVLRSTVQRGTAWRVGRALPKAHLAGKTGTSNEGRDAWFVGIAHDRLTVVWNGFDDFSDAELWGGRDAAGLFIAFARNSPGARGRQDIEAPASVRWDRTPCNGHRLGWIPRDLIENAEQDLRCRAFDPTAPPQNPSWSGAGVSLADLSAADWNAPEFSGESDLRSDAAGSSWIHEAVAMARRETILRDGWTAPNDDTMPPWIEDINLDGPLGGIQTRSWITTAGFQPPNAGADRTLVQTASLSSSPSAKSE